MEKIIQKYLDREKELGKELLRDIERQVVLQTVDELWIEHLHEMDFLKRRNWFKSLWTKRSIN